MINQAMIRRAKERAKMLAQTKEAMSSSTAGFVQIDYDLLEHGRSDMDRVGVAVPRPIKRHCVLNGIVDLSNVKVITSEEYDAIHSPVLETTTPPPMVNINTSDYNHFSTSTTTADAAAAATEKSAATVHDLSTKYGMAYSALVGTTKLMYKSTDTNNNNNNNNNNNKEVTTNTAATATDGCSSITNSNSGGSSGNDGGAVSSLSSSEVDCDSNTLCSDSEKSEESSPSGRGRGNSGSPYKQQTDVAGQITNNNNNMNNNTVVNVKKNTTNNNNNLLNCSETSTMSIEQAMGFSTKARIIVKSAFPNLVVHTNAAFASLTGDTSAHRAIGRPFSSLVAKKNDKSKSSPLAADDNHNNHNSSSEISLEDFITHKIVSLASTSASSSMTSLSFNGHDHFKPQQRINVLDVATKHKHKHSNEEQELSSMRCRVSASLVVAGVTSNNNKRRRNTLLTVGEAKRVKNITHFILELDELLEGEGEGERSDTTNKGLQADLLTLSSKAADVGGVRRYIPMFTVG